MSEFDTSAITRWRCIVCGEIVITTGGPPDNDFACPICGAVGEDVWEPILDTEGPEIILPEPYAGHCVVIGAGGAGCTFTGKLLAMCPDAHVTLLGMEPRRTYNRTAISSLLAQAGTADDNGNAKIDPMADIFPGGSQEFWEDPRLDFRSGQAGTVTGVDWPARTVYTADEHTVTFDKLVFATGSSAFIPPVEGVHAALESRIAHTLRTEQDATLLCERLGQVGRARPDQPVRVVLVGAGLLALEAVTHVLDSPVARSPGLDFVLLERCGQILSASGKDIAAAVQCAIEKQACECNSKITISTNVNVEAIEVQDGQDYAVVRATIGDISSQFDADCVLIGAGVRANCDAAVKAGMEVVQTGISVDGSLRCAVATNNGQYERTDDAYAVGDCASIEHRRPAGNWAEALAHAERAAACVAGASEQAAPPLPTALAFFVKVGRCECYNAFRRDFCQSDAVRCQLRTVRYAAEGDGIAAAGTASFGHNLGAKCVGVAQTEDCGVRIGSQLVQVVQSNDINKYREVSHLFEELNL